VRALHLGLVTAFDDDRGLGTVTDRSGRQWPFHCTAIADGTRHIDVGAAVAFVACSGPLGRDEARELTPL